MLSGRIFIAAITAINVWQEGSTATSIKQLITDKAYEPDINNHLNLLDQEDETLVKDIINFQLSFPTKVARNISSQAQLTLMGQFGQAFVVDEIFGEKREGFFVEAGAYDGETISNTLFLETRRNWTGLLVEPEPLNYNHLLTTGRKVWSLNTCLSRRKRPEVVDFDAAGAYGGIITEGLPRPSDDLPPKDREMIRKFLNERRRKVKFQCIPLFSALLALGNPEVDYLSLDIEGSELKVLETIPWDKVTIRLISVEVRHGNLDLTNLDAPSMPDNFHDIVSYMSNVGYRIYTKFYHTVEELSSEVFFVHNSMDV